MAQPGRTLVCSTYRKATSARRPPLHQGTGRRHPQLHPTPQQRPKTLRLAQNRRPDPRLRRTLLYTNFRLRTLGHVSQRGYNLFELFWWYDCMDLVIGLVAKIVVPLFFIGMAGSAVVVVISFF